MAPYQTIRSFSRPLDAQIAAARLRAHGVETRVPDEQTVSVDPLLVDALGGVRVQVRAEDMELAREILDEPPAHGGDDDEGEADDQVRCPRCDSPYVDRSWSAGQVAVALALAGIPLLTMQKRTHCQRCEHVFDAVPPSFERGGGPYRARRRALKREGKPVFRLRRRSTGPAVAFGVVLGVLAIGLVGSRLGSVILVAAPLAAWLLARGASKDLCSDPTCRAQLPPGVARCRACRGTVEGRVASAREHFVAVEAWRREPAALPAPREKRRKMRRRAPAGPAA